MDVLVGERDVFAKPGGGFSPYHSAVVVKVTSKYVFHNIGFGCVFTRTYCSLALCKVLLMRINAFVQSIAVTG